MKGEAISYSADELAWVEANCAMPRRDLHAAFAARFGREDVSQQNLASLCKRKGWFTGRTGRFVPGQAAHNSGRKGWCPKGCEKGWFSRGAKPANALPMWSERISHDGYVEIKVPRINPHTGHKTRFMYKHRYLWEEVNGPLPEGYALKSLDGDKRNCDPANWVAIPRALLPRLNGRFGRDYDASPQEIKPLIMATAKLEHAAREARRDGAKGK